MQIVRPFSQIFQNLKPGRVNGWWHLTPTSVRWSESQTRKKKLFNYTLHGVGLNETDSAKYLGVNISRDLSWEMHINQITMKTNKSLKFIKRNIQTNNLN